MSSIKENDVTSKSAGAISNTGQKITEASDLKAQLKLAQATKKELNTQLKTCDKEIKVLEKKLNSSKKSKTVAAKPKTKKKAAAKKKKKSFF